MTGRRGRTSAGRAAADAALRRAASQGWTYAYDTASNVTSAAMAGSTLLDADREHVYDSLDRLLTSRLTDSQNWGGTSVKTSWYNYDDLGSRISHQYRDAAAIGYQHDKANRMTTIDTVSQGYDP